MSFDVPVVNRFWPGLIDPGKVIDTFIVSRLVAFSHYKTHSLAEIGESLGFKKLLFKEFDQYSEEMLVYCTQDVVVNKAIYDRYLKQIDSPDWQEAIRIEHAMALIMNDMTEHGFRFDTMRARTVLSSILQEMTKLEAEFQTQWPPELQVVNELQYRLKKDGTPVAVVVRAQNAYPKTELKDGKLLCYDYVTFNAGSPKQRIEKLREAGWKPVEKTKTHFKFTSQARPNRMWGKTKLTRETWEEKKKHFAKYGWTVSEENLQTLPEDAPHGAKMLAKWLTLEGRRSTLVEWLGCEHQNRIHGNFWGIGAWTHRMSHSSPNLANISSPWPDDKPIVTAVDEVKAEYDAEFRRMFQADEGAYLVGTDAEGIQLRILAHYLRSDEYVEAIVNGVKEDKTDIHNLNLQALGLDHLTRDDAKTFKRWTSINSVNSGNPLT